MTSINKMELVINFDKLDLECALLSEQLKAKQAERNNAFNLIVDSMNNEEGLIGYDKKGMEYHLLGRVGPKYNAELKRQVPTRSLKIVIKNPKRK